MRRDGNASLGRAIDMATMRVEMKSAHGQTIKIITGSCDQWKRHCNGNGYSNGMEYGWDGERLLKKKGKGKGKGKSKPKGMANWREGKTMAVSQC